MQHNTLKSACTFTALMGLAALLGAPIQAQTNPSSPSNTNPVLWYGPSFTFDMGYNGGGQFIITHSNQNNVYLEGLNRDQSDSASEMLLTGRWGAPLPQLTAIANTTTFTGDVGIGTYYPAGSLHLLGSSVPPSGLPAGNNGLVLGSAGLSSYKWIQSYGGPLVLNLQGNPVGIGRIPSYLLDVNGPIRVQSTVYTSDARYKTHITPLPNALDTIRNLRGVSFEWDRARFADMNFASGRQIGFVAQEVEKVLPELVTTDARGYKSVAYANVVPVLVEATKAQQAQIEAQQRELESLKAQVALLTETVNQAKLERGLTGK